MSIISSIQVHSSVHLRASLPEDAHGFGSAAVSRSPEAGVEGVEAPQDRGQEHGSSQEAQQGPREQNHRAATKNHRAGELNECYRENISTGSMNGVDIAILGVLKKRS